MDPNIDFKYIYKNIKDPSEVAKEVKEILNRIDLIAVGKYNKLPEQNVIKLLTRLTNEKINLEAKQSEVERQIIALKTKMSELRINLNGIFYLIQFDSSFNHFKNIQTQLNGFTKSGQQALSNRPHSSSIWVEDKNGDSLQFGQSDLAKLFDYLCSTYAKFNNALEAFTVINKDLQRSLEVTETHLVKLDKMAFKKKIKLNLKDSISYSVNFSNISELMSENILGYYAFNIISWLFPSLIAATFIVLLIFDPFNFEARF